MPPCWVLPELRPPPKIDEFPGRRSSESCLCLEAASGIAWLRPGGPPLGPQLAGGPFPNSPLRISSSGRLSSRSSNDTRSGPSDPDMGELILGRFAVGGPASSRLSAILLGGKNYQWMEDARKIKEADKTVSLWFVIMGNFFFLSSQCCVRRSDVSLFSLDWQSGEMLPGEYDFLKAGQQRHASPPKITP